VRSSTSSFELHDAATEHLSARAARWKARTSDAFQRFSMEPDMMKWIANNMTEIKTAMTLEEHETTKMGQTIVPFFSVSHQLRLRREHYAADFLNAFSRFFLFPSGLF
jgi:hypothetical protein